jgi:hypothetical protein
MVFTFFYIEIFILQMISGPAIGNDPLNLNDILQSVAPTNFGSSSIRK